MADEKPWLKNAPIIQPLNPFEGRSKAIPASPVPEQFGDTLVSPADMERINAPPTEGGTWRNWVDPSIQQSPNAGNIVPLSNEPGAGLRLAIPNAVRGLFTEGPQLNEQGKLVVPGATINPNTGALGVTPEAATAGQLIQPNRLAFGGMQPSFVPPGTLDRRADLTGVNPLNPGVATRAAGREQFRAMQGEPPPSGAPTGAPPPGVTLAEAAPAATTATTEAMPDLATAAGAKRVADYYYKKADELGGTLTPQFTNRFIDDITKNLPQTEIGRAVAGESETAALVRRLESQRDKPMTLQGLQEADEGITALITKEYGPTGLTKDGLKLQEIQRNLRRQVLDAGEGDMQGSPAGFDALNSGRQAWAAAMKLRDLEAIRDRASRTEQPSTSIRTQVRTLLGDARKSRGYTPEEIASLEDAAQRGVLGGAFHIAGGRLMPMMAAAAGFGTGGVLGAIANAAIAGPVGTGARNVATALQERRLGRVADIVSRRVPVPNELLGPGP